MRRTLPFVLLFPLALPLPAQSPLPTRWTAGVTAANAWREYPRMQQRRERWLDLNGTWQYAVAPREAAQPTTWDGDILVPFPIESTLSGVRRRVTPEQRLWYRRTFARPDWHWNERVLLHFGAVDWHAEAWLNGRHLGEHSGGYDPFTLDVTAALREAGEQELVVAVWDPTERGPQPRGKQQSRPHGIWYTPTTGIWQTVWLEPVFAGCHIRRLWTETEPKTGTVTVRADIAGLTPALELQVTATLDGQPVAAARGAPGTSMVEFTVPAPRPWTPDSPTLYDLRVELGEHDQVFDTVDSYAGLRSIAVGTAPDGHRRLLLNGQPLFQYGVLDQGFWPDGLYTPPCDAAIRFDLEALKRLGFNMLRKHVKVEPDRFYWWCDKLGLLVWQDMPNGDGHIGPRDPDLARTPPSAFGFERELRSVVDALRGHPSIVMWVPFNEGWGQYETARIAEWLAACDPTRPVNATSGWADRAVGAVHDVHSYPGPGMPPVEPIRAAVLGEFGGLGLPLAGHTWQAEKNWGYRSYEDPAALTDAYVALVERLRWLIGEGLSAAVYTQLSDVEIEVNGLLTYDREQIKPDAGRVRAANLRLYAPPPRLVAVLATSQQEAQTWRMTVTAPPTTWAAIDFDDAGWIAAPGGFGTKETPGAVVGTTWNGADLWLRRRFDLPANATTVGLQLRIHHDEDAEVWLNGVLAAKLPGYTTGYTLAALAPEAIAALRPRGNVLAIHCHQTGGGQFVDAGLVRVED
jgi:hypothetical protein